MNITQQGQTVTRIYSDLALDPRYGPAVREVWRGNKSALLGLQAAYHLSGFRTEYSDNEGTGLLTVTMPQYNDGTPEVPSDTWEKITEWREASIWDNPRLLKLAGGDMEILSYWRKRLENAMVGNVANAASDPITYEAFDPNSKAPLTPSEAGISASVEPELYRIYQKLLRGTDTFEKRLTTLRLTRVVSANYAQRTTVDPIEKVYTTARLITDFAVPQNVARLLPADPTDSLLLPPYSTWGWKLRQDGDQIIVAANKVQETRDWIFAAWDNDLYEIVS